MVRNSLRNRTSVLAETMVAKPGGSLIPVAASTSANMSAGRRPVKWRATTSSVTRRPTRCNSSVATAIAIGSESTSTPLQSKMITRGPLVPVFRYWHATRDSLNSYDDTGGNKAAPPRGETMHSFLRAAGAPSTRIRLWR
jgi:hypothetical protein